jgi:hypothetical protein
MTLAKVNGQWVDIIDHPRDTGEPWKHSPSWGAENDVRVDALKTQPVTILGATEFPDMAAVRTVQCALAYDADPSAWPAGSSGLSRSFSIVGILEWGVGGATQRAEFDFQNGVQLSVPAQAIKVSCKLEGILSDSTPPKLGASAVISTGSPARTRQPTRTITLQPLGSGDPLDAIIPIPAFARAFGWTAATGAADANVAITVITAPLAAAYVLRAYTAAQLSDPYVRGQFTPLQEGARAVRVVAAAGLVACGQVVFSLDL